MSKLRTEEQLESKLREDLSRVPVLLQTAISGHGVGLNFCAFEGALFGVSVTTRLHEPLDGGGSSYRRTGELTPALIQVAECIAKRLQWTGMMMVELKCDDRDLYMMELNCRPWGSIELSIQSGVDYPRLVLESVMRQAAPDIRVVPARQMYVRNSKRDLGWIWRRRGAWFTKEAELVRWFWSFHRVVLGREKFDLEQTKDPVPALSQLSLSLSRLRKTGSRIVRRRSTHLTTSSGRVRVFPASSILFVCRGNNNRSVVAHHYLMARGFPRVSSAGLIQMHGRRPSAQAETYLRESFGIDASRHRSTDIRTLERDLESVELIVVFDRRNLLEL